MKFPGVAILSLSQGKVPQVVQGGRDTLPIAQLSEDGQAFRVQSLRHWVIALVACQGAGAVERFAGSPNSPWSDPRQATSKANSGPP
jgi:hypothetical protein